MATASIMKHQPPASVRRIQIPAYMFLGIGLIWTLPAFGISSYYQSFLYLIFFWIAMATSWGIFSGNTGYFSFGHGAFYGIGAYTTANLTQTYPVFLSIMAAGCLAMFVGIAIGAIVFRVKRLRGEVFALLTLALSFVVASVILNTPIDGGAGVYITGAELPVILGSPANSLYFMQSAIALFAVAVAWVVQQSRFGKGLLSISDAEDIAEVYGVPTYTFKLIALAISCFIAGLAGGVHAIFISYITVEDTFSVTVPLFVILMGVIGGARHWAGAMIGAVFIATMNTAFVGGDSALLARSAIGLTLVLAVFFLPDGVMGYVAKYRRRRSSIVSSQTPVLVHRVQPELHNDNQAPLSDRILLSCREVTLSFSGVKALDGVDLDVMEGEILGLVGPNGSGKSTLINSISGFYVPQSGTIKLNGNSLLGIAGHKISRAGVARTFQIPQPFVRMTVLDNVRLAAMFGSARLSQSEATDVAFRWLTFVGMDNRISAFPDELNLHQRKFLELARTLATGARLILLDEVLAGMTPAEINSAITLIRRIRASGATIIFVEHNIRAVLELTDRLAVLNQGKIIALGLPHEVMNAPKVVSAYVGGGYA